jgi:hypothetical protein
MAAGDEALPPDLTVRHGSNIRTARGAIEDASL